MTRSEQRVVVRYVRGPSARTARPPRSSTARTFFRGERFSRRSERLGAPARRRRERRRRSRRVPPFPRAGCTMACTWTASPSRSRASATRRTSRGMRRRDEARRATRDASRRRSEAFARGIRARPARDVERAPRAMVYRTVITRRGDTLADATCTFIASSPATAGARGRSRDPSRTRRRVAGRAPPPDPAISRRARRARHPQTRRPGATRDARAAAATGRPGTPPPPGLAR